MYQRSNRRKYVANYLNIVEAEVYKFRECRLCGGGTYERYVPFLWLTSPLVCDVWLLSNCILTLN